MYEVGRICVKIAGRDAGREAVIVDILDDKFVMIDGNVRRRKCNILHLEPTDRTVDIRKGSSHDAVKAAFVKIGFPVWETKPRKTAEKPKKIPKEKVKPEVTKAKKVKKTEKKVEKAKPPEKKASKTEKKPVKKKVAKKK